MKNFKKLSKDLLETVRHKFEEKIMPEPMSGCWLWTGTMNEKGYGMFYPPKSRRRRASRVSYILYKGEFNKNLCVCHSCDNPICVNPDHLFLGTRGDNNRDRDKKKRNNQARGIQCGATKLTEEQVLEIRKLASLGMSNKELADKFNVYKTNIWQIKTRKSWKHI